MGAIKAVQGAGRTTRARISAPAVAARKMNRDGGGERLVMVTAYDAPGARIAHRAGVDIVLVGDSLAMVVLGYEDTLQVTVEDMAHHTAAVHRGLQACEASGVEHPRPLVVGDLPWMGYHTGTHDAVRNAAMLIRAGAGAVKLEGGRKRTDVVKAIIDAEIPVMGHIGLTPQSVNAMGGFKVQGRQLSEARSLIDDAVALVESGVFAMVLEGVPDVLAKVITETVPVPVIGIGAGPDCDGQVLVWHDLLGIEDRMAPKFVRRYADIGTACQAAIEAYVEDVRTQAFPNKSESYVASVDLTEALLAGTTPEGLAAAGRVLSADAEDYLAGLYGSYVG